MLSCASDAVMSRSSPRGYGYSSSYWTKVFLRSSSTISDCEIRKGDERETANVFS